MSQLSFTPYSSLFRLTVGVASAAVPQPVVSPAPTAIAPFAQALDYRFTNIGTQAVFIATAAAGAAAPTAAIPASGASGAVFIIEPNSCRTFVFPYGTQFAAIAPLAGSDLYVSIGDGVAL